MSSHFVAVVDAQGNDHVVNVHHILCIFENIDARYLYLAGNFRIKLNAEEARHLSDCLLADSDDSVARPAAGR